MTRNLRSNKLESSPHIARSGSSREKRKLDTASARRWIPLLLVLMIFPIVYGCSANEGAENNSSRQYIIGEVTDVVPARGSARRSGDIGTVLLEGSRSSPTDEALMTITNKTRIVDRKGTRGAKVVDFASIKETRTAEAYFQVLSSSPKPWRAVASEIFLDP